MSVDSAVIYRRQVVLFGVIVSLLMGILLDMLVPGLRGRIAGTAWGIVCAAFTVSVAGGVRMSSGRRALVSAVALLLMLCVIAYGFAPNLRRMLVQKRVEGLGGFVETSFDEGDGLWFPFEDVYLPRAFHESLGESFFGRITKVHLDACRVRFEQVRDMDLLSSVDGLNLSGAQITSTDLARVVKVVDVRSLEMGLLPMNEDILMLCGRVPSLEWLDVTGTDVDDESARRFAEQYSHVTLLYGKRELQIRKGRHVLR